MSLPPKYPRKCPHCGETFESVQPYGHCTSCGELSRIARDGKPVVFQEVYSEVHPGTVDELLPRFVEALVSGAAGPFGPHTFLIAAATNGVPAVEEVHRQLEAEYERLAGLLATRFPGATTRDSEVPWDSPDWAGSAFDDALRVRAMGWTTSIGSVDFVCSFEDGGGRICLAVDGETD